MSKLKLMYITNKPHIATLAENAGVDRVFVDMEYIGKSDRQGGMDTVQSRHTIEDVKAVRKQLKKAKLLVRCNPIHNATDEYSSSKQEIDEIVNAGADIIMLPFFKTAKEVEDFVSFVDKRVKTMLLFETKQAVDNIDEILQVEGIDECYIGLNDLSLSCGYNFMFNPLANGMVDNIVEKFKQRGLPFGFGGIAVPGGNVPLPAERIILEHVRLGSTCAILSRSFCNTEKVTDEKEITKTFVEGVKKIQEAQTLDYMGESFEENKEKVAKIVKEISNKQ